MNDVYGLGENLLFVISPPRSGSTLLQRMLGSHSDVATKPEPHLITPLAYLGFHDHVDKAPYDAINSAEAIRLFVSTLPGQRADYIDAVRAYANTLYGRALQESRRRYFMDKTPAYALVLPFLAEVFPRARYVVLTRHPLGVFSSYANSFFDGSWSTAHHYNHLVEKYVPAIARFLQQSDVPFVHVRYEDLVREPEAHMARVFAHCEIENDPSVVNYGEKFAEQQGQTGGPGDPITVAKQTRPTEKNAHKWAQELNADASKRELAETMIAALSQADLAAWGYDHESLWAPLALAGAKAPNKPELSSYVLQRKIMLALKKDIDKRPHGKLVRGIKYYCDVLLRDSMD